MKTRSMFQTLPIFVLALSVALGPGCKKDEAPADGAQQTAEGNNASPSPASAAKASPVKVDKAAGPALSDGVLGVVGLSSLKDIAGYASAAGNRLAPGAIPPNSASMVLEHLKADLGFTDISWLAQDKPIYVVLASDPSLGERNSAMVLPVADEARMKASLKPGATDAPEGHLAAYEHALTRRYLDLSGSSLVVAEHKGLFAAVKSFVVGPLATWKPGGLTALHLDMERVSSRYRAEIAGLKAMLLAATDPNTQGGGNLEIDVNQDQLNQLLALAEGAGTLDLLIQGDETKLTLILGGTGKAGTLTSRLFGAMKDRTCELASLAPSGSWLAGCAHMDTRKIEEMNKVSGAQIEGIFRDLNVPAEARPALKAEWKKLMDMSLGDNVTGVSAEGGFPFAAWSVSDCTDGVAFHKTTLGLIDMAVPHLWSALSQAMAAEGKELPAAKIERLDDLVNMASPFVAAFGLTLRPLHDKKGDIPVDGVSLKLDWKVLQEQVAREPGDAEQLALLEKLIGDELALVLAAKGDKSAFAFGPSAVDMAVGLVEGKRPATSSSIAKLGEDAGFAGVLDAQPLLKSLQANPALAAQLPPGLTNMEGLKQPITVRGGSDGDYASLKVDLPLGLIQVLVGLAMN